MPNVSFDGTDLATLGFSLKTLQGRGMADWNVSSIEIPGRSSIADMSRRFVIADHQTVLSGTLSADTDDWELYTHDEWLARFDAIKKQVHPRKGFRKLIVLDKPDRFRWARYQTMSDFTEEGPGALKRPFHPLNIVFQNLEPFWREPHEPVTVTAAPFTVPNVGADDSQPVVTLNIGTDILGTPGPTTETAILFTIDDLQVAWTATTPDGQLSAGDQLIIDSNNLMAVRVSGGIPEDMTRYYDFAGPAVWSTNGFPTIQFGGSLISTLHPNITSAVFEYDSIYP